MSNPFDCIPKDILGDVLTQALLKKTCRDIEALDPARERERCRKEFPRTYPFPANLIINKAEECRERFPLTSPYTGSPYIPTPEDLGILNTDPDYLKRCFE